MRTVTLPSVTLSTSTPARDALTAEMTACRCAAVSGALRFPPSRFSVVSVMLLGAGAGTCIGMETLVCVYPSRRHRIWFLSSRCVPKFTIQAGQVNAQLWWRDKELQSFQGKTRPGGPESF